MVISYFQIIGIIILSSGVIFSSVNVFGQVDYNTDTTVSVNVKNAQSDDGFLPVVVVQNMTSSAFFPNNLTIWNIDFEPHLNRGSNQTSMVQTTRLNFTATDAHKQNIIESSSNGFFISDDMVYSIPVSCNDNLKDVDFGKFFLPIRNTTSIIINYSNTELKQDRNGTYHLQFASFSNVKIKLPPNAHIITNETNICNSEKIGQRVNLYSISFYLENYYPVPEFPFVISILLVSVMALVVFYRIKIRD